MIKNCECGVKNKHLKSAFSSGQVDFRKCPKCQLFFRSQFPSKGELNRIYRSAYSLENVLHGNTDQESPNFSLEIYSQFIQNTYKPFRGLPLKFLDFGAGAGALVKKLRMAKLKADGFEYSGDARQACFEQKGIKLLSSLRQVPKGNYDVVTMIEVVEHLTELQKTLIEIRRVMAPGGRIFITTPNRLGIRALLERGNWREAKKKYHLFLFDSNSLSYHLKLAGFSSVHRQFFGPVQKKGILPHLYSRIFQFLGLGGTLYFHAKNEI